MDFRITKIFIYSIFVILILSIQQGKALKSVNVSNCFNFSSPKASENPLCSLQISQDSPDVAFRCMRQGVLQVEGDYKVLYINCTAGYPLDFKFDGHKPTEAIQTNSWALVEKKSGGKFKSFHLDIKIFSIPSLYEHYASLHSYKKLSHHDDFNYSRTGNYIFSGYRDQEHLQSKFYFFFEEKWALPSFLKNEDLELHLPRYDNENEEYLPLVIPCRPSHFYGNVTIQQVGNIVDLHYVYDATVGFTTNGSWKSIVESRPEVLQDELKFTCTLAQAGKLNDTVEFSTTKRQVQYGHAGLPNANISSLFTNVLKLPNGTILVRHQCSFDNTVHNSQEEITLAVLGVSNPTDYRLIQHFIFPEFHSRSYSISILNSSLYNGVARDHITTTYLSTSVLCKNSVGYQAVSVGVSVRAKYNTYKIGEDFAKAERAENYHTKNYFKISYNQPSYELYQNQLVIFRCFILSFVHIRPAVWYTVRADGSVVEEVIDYDWKQRYFSYAAIKLTPDVKQVICASSLWHKAEWRNISMQLTLKECVKPTFVGSQKSVVKFSLNSGNRILKCSATGIPQPQIYWQRNGRNLTAGAASTARSSMLEFPSIKREDEGEYICIASNPGGVEKKIFTVQVFTEAGSDGLIIGVSIAIFICGTVAIAVWAYVRLRRNSEIGLTQSEIYEFLNGEKRVNPLNQADSKGNDYAEMIQLCPYQKEYEIASNRFAIDTEKVLGSGEYGMVIMGSLDGTPVAIKTVKRNAEKSYLKALLSELKVMIFLGDHENIVGILGANTNNLRTGRVYIFVPFCARGSLENYLRENRHCFGRPGTEYINTEGCTNADAVEMKELRPSGSNQYSNANEKNTGRASIANTRGNNPDIITTENLLLWSIQIAKGMEYLSSKKVIHGDLAARNVLLTENLTAKITDFGLSCRLYDYSEYAKKHQEPLPWRWMSLESLRDLKFSTKSDVWSYGITLWEIFSLAQVPYPGCSWTLEFVEELENGLRMSKPQHAPDRLFNEMMTDCWHNEPELRPSFSQIVEYLNIHYSPLITSTPVRV